jgi:hypothetical protein
VVLALPVVVPVEPLVAVAECEPLFQGPHINSAPTIRTAAMIAARVPPPMPLRRSSSEGLVLRSFCISFSKKFEREKHAKIVKVPNKIMRPVH